MAPATGPRVSTLPNSNRLQAIALASIAVAVLVMALKYMAYVVTGSAALYSDALESVVNIVASAAALLAIRVSAKPADKEHPFGHHKAEYLSAVLEGALVIVAALLILAEAWAALANPRTLTEPALGLAINGGATTINALWAAVLVAAGRRAQSPALAADGWHIASDVVTSAGVLAGLVLATLSGWSILDPLLAIAVAGNVLWVGYRLVGRSMSGLMDEAASPDIENRIRDAIVAHGGGALQVHDIRTRRAARALFIEFHLVVPGAMTVAEAHVICDRLEAAIESAIQGAEVVIHVEPEEKAKTAGAVEL